MLWENYPGNEGHASGMEGRAGVSQIDSRCWELIMELIMGRWGRVHTERDAKEESDFLCGKLEQNA